MSFFGDIPHGKNDLPQLLAMKAPEFNIEDVDGAEYMLDVFVSSAQKRSAVWKMPEPC